MSKLASENYNNIEVKAEVRPSTNKSNLLRYLIFIWNSYKVEDCPASSAASRREYFNDGAFCFLFLLLSSPCKIKFYQTVDKLTDKSPNQ